MSLKAEKNLHNSCLILGFELIWNLVLSLKDFKTCQFATYVLICHSTYNMGFPAGFNLLGVVKFIISKIFSNLTTETVKEVVPFMTVPIMG